MADTFDGFYLANDLGDDATPTLDANLSRLSKHQQSLMLSRLCGQQAANETWSWNRRRMHRRRAGRAVCSGYNASAS